MTGEVNEWIYGVINAMIDDSEGGFVNDKSDRGGATNMGITIGTMRALKADIDGDGDIDVDDVKKLTRERAVDIYLKQYFYRPGIDRLHPAIQDTVFDMYVNAGNNAIILLQTLANRFGANLNVDKNLGPRTAAAVNQLVDIDAALFRSAYGEMRRDYYYRIADRRIASRKYARRKDGGKGGWIVRAEKFMDAQWRLTDAQHKERVKEWA